MYCYNVLIPSFC
ncbi:hypothetical protein GQ607_012536 [Colletotrichum asianum]|uniref:Uncharacterized protein n=1 Tax=Colletotrichum asianum TaxID=702518 RepID=A0A8H3ZHS7_9PEZI|nr:hypothetical protein GQ607_012536 [Colletotrichum asianum]